MERARLLFWIWYGFSYCAFFIPGISCWVAGLYTARVLHQAYSHRRVKGWRTGSVRGDREVYLGYVRGSKHDVNHHQNLAYDLLDSKTRTAAATLRPYPHF